MVRKDQAMQTLQDFQMLSTFLGTHYHTRNFLRTNLQNIAGFEEIMADILQLCLHAYEDHIYLQPKEKHMFVKVRKHVSRAPFQHFTYDALISNRYQNMYVKYCFLGVRFVSAHD